MAKFSFKHLEISPERTARCKLGVALHKKNEEAPAVLIVLPALEENKPYFNEALRLADHSMAKKATTAATLEELRERDRGLFATHVIRGWQNVFDSETGEEVPFSIDSCVDLIRALPPKVFDVVRVFAKTDENFVTMNLDAAAASKS